MRKFFLHRIIEVYSQLNVVGIDRQKLHSRLLNLTDCNQRQQGICQIGIDINGMRYNIKVTTIDSHRILCAERPNERTSRLILIP